MLNDDILAILMCSDCSGELCCVSNDLKCIQCSREFPVSNDGIIQMMPASGKPKPDIYNDPNYVRWQQVSSEALEEYFENDNWLFRKIHDSAHNIVSQWARTKPGIGWTIDIGCGTGYHYQYFSGMNRIVGIDSNMDSLHKIREKYSETTLIQADCTRLPIRDSSVNRAFSIYNLEHIYYFEDAIRDACRVLADDGAFMVGLPCEGGLPWNLGRKDRFQENTIWTTESLLQLNIAIRPDRLLNV